MPAQVTQSRLATQGLNKEVSPTGAYVESLNQRAVTTGKLAGKETAKLLLANDDVYDVIGNQFNQTLALEVRSQLEQIALSQGKNAAYAEEVLAPQWFIRAKAFLTFTEGLFTDIADASDPNATTAAEVITNPSRDEFDNKFGILLTRSGTVITISEPKIKPGTTDTMIHQITMSYLDSREEGVSLGGNIVVPSSISPDNPHTLIGYEVLVPFINLGRTNEPKTELIHVDTAPHVGSVLQFETETRGTGKPIKTSPIIAARYIDPKNAPTAAELLVMLKKAAIAAQGQYDAIVTGGLQTRVQTGSLVAEKAPVSQPLSTRRNTEEIVQAA